MVCTFFGHKNTPPSAEPLLERQLAELAERYPSIEFIEGNNGSFDRMVLAVVKRLSEKYPDIKYTVVLAHFPKDDTYKDIPTLLPEGIENVPKRFAISYRNRWMTSKADIVVCYITHSYGGAAQFAELAKKQRKTVINIASSPDNDNSSE